MLTSKLTWKSTYKLTWKLTFKLINLEGDQHILYRLCVIPNKVNFADCTCAQRTHHRCFCPAKQGYIFWKLRKLSGNFWGR